MKNTPIGKSEFPKTRCTPQADPRRFRAPAKHGLRRVGCGALMRRFIQPNRPRTRPFQNPHQMMVGLAALKGQMKPRRARAPQPFNSQGKIWNFDQWVPPNPHLKHALHPPFARPGQSNHLGRASAYRNPNYPHHTTHQAPHRP